MSMIGDLAAQNGQISPINLNDSKKSLRSNQHRTLKPPSNPKTDKERAPS